MGENRFSSIYRGVTAKLSYLIEERRTGRHEETAKYNLLS